MDEAVRGPVPSGPLPASQLHILLALADGEKHGYAIMREVARMTDGTVTMGPGTLYGTLKRMLAAGLVVETDERPDPELDDERRRYYRATGVGLRTLDGEAERLALLVQLAQRKRTGRAPRPAIAGGSGS